MKDSVSSTCPLKCNILTEVTSPPPPPQTHAHSSIGISLTPCGETILPVFVCVCLCVNLCLRCVDRYLCRLTSETPRECVCVCVLTHAVGGAAPHQQTAGAQQVEHPEQQDPPRLQTTTNKQESRQRAAAQAPGRGPAEAPSYQQAVL